MACSGDGLDDQKCQVIILRAAKVPGDPYLTVSVSAFYNVAILINILLPYCKTRLEVVISPHVLYRHSLILVWDLLALSQYCSITLLIPRSWSLPCWIPTTSLVSVSIIVCCLDYTAIPHDHVATVVL